MPRIKRWFPVSHSFNRDPEIRLLRQKFGDWMGFVWQEFCSIGDMNDGIVQGTIQQLAETHAYISLWTRQGPAAKKIEMAIEYMVSCGWIAIKTSTGWVPNDGRTKLERWSNNHRTTLEQWSNGFPTDCIFIVNHAKYHIIKEQEKVPPDLSEPEPNLKKTKKSSFPLDYKLNETLLAWCLQQHVSDPSPHLEAFKDFHVAKGSRFADWDAAFRNWIRNSARFNGRGTVTKLQPEGELSERTQRILRRGL